MTTLIGKTAIVTGGSRGIGLAIARALVTSDVNVMITGTKEKPLEDAIRELGALAMAQRADVRDYADVERAFNAAAAHFGGVDILVNNAGVGIFTPVANMSIEQWHQVIETNVTGAFHCSRAVLPHLRKRGGGWIVNISSLSGTNPFANGAAYCASKGGVVLLTKAMAIDHGRENIRVNCICPGDVETPMLPEDARFRGLRWDEYIAGCANRPMGRVGTAEEIAKVALFLASDDSSFMTGAAIAVDGGGTAD